MVAGAVISAYGQQQQAKAQQAAANYNAAIADQNAQAAREAAADAEDRGEIDARRQQVLTAGGIGAARASAAARGVDVNLGSAVDVQADIGGAGKLDELNRRNQARREALGYMSRARDFTASGQLGRFEGASARRAANISSTATLVSSVGGVASKWYRDYKTIQ